MQDSDGSVDPKARHLYKNGSRFESSGDKVAIDEIRFASGDFIIFHNKTLNRNTTIANLRELFPNAVKKVGWMEVAGEGRLQVMELKEDQQCIRWAYQPVHQKWKALFYALVVSVLKPLISATLSFQKII